MIGKSVSNAVLDGWTGAFYEWEGDVKVRQLGQGLVGCTKASAAAAELSYHEDIWWGVPDAQSDAAFPATAALLPHTLTHLPTCLAYSLPLLQELLDGVRNTVNSVGAGWSREEKDACLQETPATFTWGGQLVSLITGGKPVGPH